LLKINNIFLDGWIGDRAPLKQGKSHQKSSNPRNWGEPSDA
jgi:hypothetical protein